MAAGYVIAIALEAAGLVALVLGLLMVRAEKQAKAAELKGFLRSGQPIQRAPRVAAPPARPEPAAIPAGDILVTGAPADASLGPSEAREALRRAFPDLPEFPAAPRAAA
ncbi:hypothetical protein [Methylobacterium oxalidis]|uniref:hypothetical protein n=1 Tax=Methylobacterium oxalidis TaxID=944322 RepID=UPI003314615C